MEFVSPTGHCWNHYNLRSIASKRNQTEQSSYKDKICTRRVSRFTGDIKSPEKLLNCSPSTVKRWKETEIVDSNGNFFNEDFVEFKKNIKQKC